MAICFGLGWGFFTWCFYDGKVIKMEVTEGKTSYCVSYSISDRF